MEILIKILSIIEKNISIFALLTLLLNVVALFFVACQTCLTRKSLNMAKRSIDETRKVRQIETLPYVNYIIAVEVTIERWKTKCEKLAKSLEEIIEKKDIESIHKISKQGEESPKGLVDKYIYESVPKWLAYILMSAAQHYYNSACLMKFIWDEKEQKPKKHMLDKELVSRFRESSYNLTELLNYIKDMVPKAYLETPASIKNESFLSD